MNRYVFLEKELSIPIIDRVLADFANVYKNIHIAYFIEHGKVAKEDKELAAFMAKRILFPDYVKI